MSTILFPTDFSQTANNAFLYALNLAKVLHTDIRLITLKTHLKEYLNMPEDIFDTKVNELKSIAVENNLGDVNIISSLEIGDLLMSVLDIIEKENIKYVVMGTNGENSFGKKLFGSQTLSVINNSPVPVLAIPHQLKYHPERKFAFATMLDAREDAALQEIIEIANKHSSPLNVVHVETKSITSETLIKKREWQVNHPYLELDIVQKEDVEKGLLEYCNNKMIDVLGVVRRDLNIFQRLFTESNSKQLLNNSNFAILVLKGK
ncbi:universal stress protein [Faecalibacter rhinopitheci]|uniref:Universal stress protein n=1 Tax=Faecalibacter rhinopitheci TaxID=2779678 RepID=A0A8J7K4U2_9FLAO|nr:universal stress protein [Faecalibacter rhinopitheci]MBF0597833.1 universal stress protein [Faecalibacter rhinopitheci]